jgi:hypothetical protein
LKNEMLAHVDISFSKMLCAIFSHDTQRKHNEYHQKKKEKKKSLNFYAMQCPLAVGTIGIGPTSALSCEWALIMVRPTAQLRVLFYM